MSCYRCAAEILVQVTYQKVVLCVFKDEVDALLFKHNFAERRDIDVQDLSIDLFIQPQPQSISLDGAQGRLGDEETHHDLAASTLRDSGVGDDLALLVGFELFDRDEFPFFFAVVSAQLDPLAGRRSGRGAEQASGRCFGGVLPDTGLVHAAVGSGGEESEDCIAAVDDVDHFGSVSIRLLRFETETETCLRTVGR